MSVPIMETQKGMMSVPIVESQKMILYEDITTTKKDLGYKIKVVSIKDSTSGNPILMNLSPEELQDKLQDKIRNDRNLQEMMKRAGLLFI